MSHGHSEASKRVLFGMNELDCRQQGERQFHQNRSTGRRFLEILLEIAVLVKRQDQTERVPAALALVLDRGKKTDHVF